MGWNPVGRLLGYIADREGACQGTVGVAAAIEQRVIFRPDRHKMSKRQVNRKLRRAIGLYQNDCKNGKIYIDGYNNTKELCRDRIDMLKKKSVWYNLKIARKEILKKLNFFFKDMLDTPQEKTGQILKTLEKFQKELKKGRNPLMLVRNHVTMVTGMNVLKNTDGTIRKIVLSHYDPNKIMSSKDDLSVRTYTFDNDRQLVEGRLIWDVTPDPLTRFNCLFIKKDLK